MQQREEEGSAAAGEVSSSPEYSEKGTQVLVQVLTECGMRCRCSLRRCRNREVAKGLRWGLQVYSPPASEESESSQTDEDEEDYGVITRNKISAGSFVCEITGQYVLKGETSTSYKIIDCL
jgi:hypothetical protein